MHVLFGLDINLKCVFFTREFWYMYSMYLPLYIKPPKVTEIQNMTFMYFMFAPC